MGTGSKEREVGGRERRWKKELKCGMYIHQLHTRKVNMVYCDHVLIKIKIKDKKQNQKGCDGNLVYPNSKWFHIIIVEQ